MSNEIYELRILNVPHRGTVAGYFDNLDRLKDVAREWSGRAPGVYRTLNPVNPALLSRAANRVQEFAKQTTSDADIVQRRWLPIDFDPVRPAGISSTDQEHEAAIARAKQAAIWLAELGFPAGILADSGNGAHLLYRIDLPNTPESTAIVKKCLEALALSFTDNAVAVDLTCYNAARIWKVYDTLAAKGDNTPDRPHRMARVLDKPSKLEIVSGELLGVLAGMVPPEPKREVTRQGVSQFNIDDWITSHELDVVTSGPWAQGGRKWILAQCPWNADHTNRSAYIVELAGGAIGAGCHHNGCVGKGWPELRQLLEPERQREPYPGNAGEDKNSIRSLKEGIGKETNWHPLSAGEILTLSTPEIAWIWDGLIPAGCLFLLCAYMKVGKTTLAYRVALAIAQGLTCLDRTTTKTGVLILAVEEHIRDIRRRLERFGMTAEMEIYVIADRGQARDLDKIQEFIKAKGIGLVLVDSLSRWWDVVDENNNMEVLRAVSPLLDMAHDDTLDVSIGLIVHERKSGGEDGRGIRGGSSLFGLVDQAIILDRRPGEPSNKRLIKTLGRYEDSPKELVIELVGNDYSVIGTTEDESLIQAVGLVRGTLSSDGQSVEPLDVKTISAETGLTQKKVREVLKSLGDEIEKIGDGVKGNPAKYSIRSQYLPIGKETNSRAEIEGQNGFVAALR